MASNLVPGTGKHGTLTNPTGLAGSVSQNPPFSVEIGRTQAGSSYTTVTSSDPLIPLPDYGVTGVILSGTVSTQADGPQTSIATTVSPAGGTGCKVSYTVSSNVASGATVAVAGSGYSIGDVLTVTGDTGVTLTVTSLG